MNAILTVSAEAEAGTAKAAETDNAMIADLM
jgi:hypothetical protein